MPTSTSQFRVAFVDDEAPVLEALANVFRRYRREWSMSFFTDPVKAVEGLLAEPFDVVVVDARMAKLSGEALLREVRARSPGVARVVLSGQTSTDEVARLLAVAHQYLTKPCEPSQLAEVINRVAQVRKRLSEGPLKVLVTGGGQLPAAPKVWADLSQLLSNERAQLSDVARVIERDAALVAKVLHVANSAYFGPPQKVVALSRAISLLGLEVLRSVALLLETERSFPVVGMELDQMRQRSLRAGRVARALMPAGPLADAAFTAALVADLGALLLGARTPREFLPLWASHASHETEETTLGFSHGPVGAWLLSLWGLPSSVVDMVALHHVAPVDQAPSSPSAAVWWAVALVEAWERAPDGPLPDEVARYVARHELGAMVERARSLVGGASP